ncbi:MAG: universal stress protein [Ramlibacter sp.]|nr:universal stress protein [Ramlibacter sp.]MCW5648673.1 universal stress protein [Ramlibacter sp.]
MKVLLAADGSKFTKKALGWLMANRSFDGEDDELVVLHVQAPMPPRVRAAVSGEVVKGYYEEEAVKVLTPIERFLKRHDLRWRARWVVGVPADEILRAATREKAHLIVMGTHGRGLVGRVLMGSVAQNVLADSKVPVLLVR